MYYNNSKINFDYTNNVVQILNINHETMDEETAKLSKYLANNIPRNIDKDDENLINLIDLTLWELNGNMIEHSGYTNNSGEGFVYAQNDDNLNTIKLCIVDTGKGIPTTLKKKEKYKNLSNKEALFKSLEKHITSVDVKQGIRGVGLFRVDEFIAKNKGILDIYTENCHYHRDANNTFCNIDEHSFWQGSIIIVSFKKDNPVSFKAIVGEKLDNYYESIEPW